jgi:hypothetical protein
LTPFRIRLTCYRVLAATGDDLAPGVLRHAHDLLQARAARITDPALRHSFLENVIAHRDLIAAFRQEPRCDDARIMADATRCD